MKLEDLAKEAPCIHSKLIEISKALEKHYRNMQVSIINMHFIISVTIIINMQDIEFTVESKHLYILQTRTGKRTPPADVKMAVDMVEEGLINSR